MRRLFRLVILLALIVAIAPARSGAQGLEYVQANYTKYEYKIPMRDGTRLFTAVYVPKRPAARPPILLTRTPYAVGPYGVDRYKDNLGPSPIFGKSEYIFAYQDVRGRWMSEGVFMNMRPYIENKAGKNDFDETSDAFDTIDWLVKNVPGNNGKVGMWGISYPGFYTAAGMIDAHPALKAASPQAPVTDWFVGDDWHHNGAFFTPHAFNFLAVFGRPRPEPTNKFDFRFDPGTPDGYRFFLRLGSLAEVDAKYFKGDVAFWTEIMKHGTYDDFWKARNLRPHIKRIKPAVMTVGGWFDAENLFGALETFRNVEASARPESVNILVMGPWSHGGWSGGDGSSLGAVPFKVRTGEYFREQIEFPFFERFLKGDSEVEFPKAIVFETGTNRFRDFDRWPPAEARPTSLYLRSGGKLALEPPAEDRRAFDEYVSDPAKPVPYLETTTFRMAGDYMIADQRFAGRRPDVLVYESEILDEDFTIVGPIKVDLHVQTSGTDSDWIVKLIDVYPDDFPDPDPNPAGIHLAGYQQMVRGDVMRGKFYKGLDKPEALPSNSPVRMRFTMQDVDHSFRRGHRMMIQVQSSWFPLVDRNPQKFVDIYAAKVADFEKATQRVYRDADRASRIEVLKLDAR